jgi:predicted small lipoprotein YifL
MKKIVALLLALCMVFALCACGETKPAEPKAEEAAPAEEVVVEEAPAEEAPAEEAPAVMSYEEFAAAELDSPVVVECYVQAHQSWWDNQITVYAQDPDGAYFLYNMPCSEEDAAKLVPGQKIRVTGVKAEWSGEIEIIDSSFEFLDAEPWIAEPVDATEFWGSPDLITYQNRLVSFKDVIIEAYDESGAAFAYKDPDGKTDDLYFKVSKDGVTYDFCVEFYLCGNDTDVYKAVEGLKVGDTVDLEGFLYWYNGANPHITGVTVK